MTPLTVTYEGAAINASTRKRGVVDRLGLAAIPLYLIYMQLLLLAAWFPDNLWKISIRHRSNSFACMTEIHAC